MVGVRGFGFGFCCGVVGGCFLVVVQLGVWALGGVSEVARVGWGEALFSVAELGLCSWVVVLIFSADGWWDSGAVGVGVGRGV